MAPHATSDAPTQRPPVDCKVRANRRGINEADGLSLTTFNGREPRKRSLVVFVLVPVEPQPPAETDGRRKFWGVRTCLASSVLNRANVAEFDKAYRRLPLQSVYPLAQLPAEFRSLQADGLDCGVRRLVFRPGPFRLYNLLVSSFKRLPVLSREARAKAASGRSRQPVCLSTFHCLPTAFGPRLRALTLAPLLRSARVRGLFPEQSTIPAEVKAVFGSLFHLQLDRRGLIVPVGESHTVAIVVFVLLVAGLPWSWLPARRVGR